MTSRIPSSLALSQPCAPGWTRHALPAELGDCHSERFTLGDGIVLARSHYCPLRDLVEDSVHADASDQGRTLVITLGRAGESGCVARTGAARRCGAGPTTLAAFRGSQGERRYAAGQTVRQLRLLLSGAALDRYLGAELSQRLTQVDGVRALDHRASLPASLALARRLAQPPGPQPTDALDRHIAMLSLAALELRHLAPMPQPAKAAPRWSADELARLERARELLATQMDRELTLAYLSAAVGLGEHRLKQGFRAVFGTTPQALLLELRMRRAWALLETGCQVAQAGWQVGYAHPSNFSAAFTRFYGRSPKSVFGRRS
jgi:AraC-like DNA-binding protein